MRNKSKRDEKQEFLDEIISSKRIPSRFELMQMYRMEKDKDSCIRWSLAEALVNRYTPESEAMLRRMACDKDGLVRIEAIDSLCIGREEAVLPLLRRKMRQADDYLERGYAVLSYFDVWLNRYGYHRESMSRYLKSVEGLYTQEEHLWVLAMCERNRYFAGEKEALQKLKAILLDKGINDYYVLRAVISVMEEMMNVSNKDKIPGVFAPKVHLLRKMKEKIPLKVDIDIISYIRNKQSPSISIETTVVRMAYKLGAEINVILQFV